MFGGHSQRDKQYGSKLPANNGVYLPIQADYTRRHISITIEKTSDGQWALGYRGEGINEYVELMI